MALEIKKGNALAILIITITVIVVGLGLFDALTDPLAKMDDTDTVENESITLASGTGTTANDDVVSISEFMNGTITDSNSLVNETVAIAGLTGITANSNIITMTEFSNGSDYWNICDSCDTNWSLNGTILTAENVSDDDYDVSYSYIPVSQFWVTTDDDFNVTKSSGVLYVNTTVGDGSYLITYVHEPDTYVADSISRTILNNTILLFFGLAILLAVIGWLYGGLKEFLDK